MPAANEYPVLLFHSVDDRDVLSLKDLGNIRPEVFEKTLAALGMEFDIISLEDMIGCICGVAAGPDRPLAITFDDGAKSYISHAVPIMKSHGIPSTCFLITDCMGDRAIYWRYLYNYCVHAGLNERLEKMIKEEYDVPALEGGLMRFTRNSFSRKKTELIIERILGSMVSEREYREREGRLFLSLEDLQSLKADPLVTFGIHTRSHPVMIGLTYEEIRDEISGSLDFCSKWIGKDVPMFSVPFGRLYRDYDERTIMAARDLSIERVFSAYGGGNRAGQPSINIRRIPVREDMLGDGFPSFLARLRNGSAVGVYMESEARLLSAMERYGSKTRKRL